MFRPSFAAAALVSLCFPAAFPAPVSAQDTRAALLERQRAEKATILRPYQAGTLEKTILWLEEKDLATKIAPHNGFYGQYGFQWKPVGSGLGLGGGYRRDLFDRTARVDVGGGYTLRGYRMLKADFSLPYLADERLEAGVRAVHNHNPQEDFWGHGTNTLPDDRVSFGADYLDVQARAIARPVRWLQAAIRIGRLSPEISQGSDKRFPSIEERFSDADAPGLVEQPSYRYAEVSGAIDRRDQQDNARAGGYYAVRWRTYNDLDLDRYSFRELDVHAQQFFPIFDKKRVFALQGRLLSTAAGDGQEVPFYFRPTLGGGTTLRSYADYRFRDRHVLYVNAEYRWEAFSGLDMALFYDVGTTAPALDALSFSNVKDGYGIGLRFNTYKAVWLRIDIGLGGAEGTRYFFKFSKAF